MTTALLDRLTHRCHILETGNDSYRFKASAEAAKITGKETCQSRSKKGQCARVKLASFLGLRAAPWRVCFPYS